MLRRAIPHADEILSQQIEAVVAAAAFRARSTASSAAASMLQDPQAVQGKTPVEPSQSLP